MRHTSNRWLPEKEIKQNLKDVGLILIFGFFIYLLLFGLIIFLHFLITVL